MNDGDINPGIAALLDGYRAAVLAKDVASFAALYAEDVRVFDAWAAWSCDGRDAWRGVAAGWFASLAADERVHVEWADVTVRASSDLASVSAFVRYRAESADGTPLRGIDNRLSWALARIDSGWRIVHEHTSMPVSPDLMQALMQR